MGWWVGGPCDFGVSPKSKSLLFFRDFGGLGGQRDLDLHLSLTKITLGIVPLLDIVQRVKQKVTQVVQNTFNKIDLY